VKAPNGQRQEQAPRVSTDKTKDEDVVMMVVDPANNRNESMASGDDGTCLKDGLLLEPNNDDGAGVDKVALLLKEQTNGTGTTVVGVVNEAIVLLEEDQDVGPAVVRDNLLEQVEKNDGTPEVKKAGDVKKQDENVPGVVEVAAIKSAQASLNKKDEVGLPIPIVASNGDADAVVAALLNANEDVKK